MRFHSVLIGAVAAAAFAPGVVSPSPYEASATPLKARVDMKALMEHVVTPAATVIWRVNGSIIDATGEHDLSPRTDEDWERVAGGAATLAEATNALMIPERVRDREWIKYAEQLAAAAVKAYRGAEAHDLKTVSEVSDQLDDICTACHRHYGLE